MARPQVNMSAPSPRNSRLPASLTPFLGREAEIAQIREVLPTTRLLTLTGPGGSGKTRLAIEIARRAWAAKPDALRWVELAPLANGDLMAEHVAACLQARQQPHRSTIDVLVDSLQGVDLLLLDNCEHVVDAAAPLVEALLQRCESLTVLATSREALGIDGERAWLLRGLSTEARDQGEQGSEARRFFLERARAVNQSLVKSASSSAAIDQICRRLDGMPLALELAAARTSVLAPEQIAERLDDAFRLLVSGNRTALPRHRTLAAAVEWSYRLISPAEQTLLRRLAVFAGPFSLEAAEYVCSGDGIEPREVLDLLSGLVKRSLVTVHDAPDAARYSLLEIIRQFAVEQGLGGDGFGTLSVRHAEFYASMAETALGFLEESHSPAWIEKLSAEYANIRVALQNCYREGDARNGHRLVGSLWWYWGQMWQISEWRYWMDEALRFAEGASGVAWGQVLNGAGTLAYLFGDLERGRRLLRQAAEELERSGDRVHEAMTRASLGNLLWNAGEIEAAYEEGHRAVSLARLVEQAMPMCHAMTNALAPAQIARGELDQAELGLEEAARKATAREHVYGAVLVARARAALALDRQHFLEASRHTLCALGFIREIQDPHSTFRVLHVLVRVLAARQQHDEAARLLGTMDKTMEAGMPLLSSERLELEDVRRSVQAALGPARYSSRTADGHRESPGDMLSRGYETLSRLDAAAMGGGAAVAARALHVRTLGRFSATLGGDSWLEGARQAKLVELLVLLLCHPAGRTREQLGLELWPDASAAQVKNNFHVLLHRLRRSLGDDDVVIVEGERYLLGPELQVWFDVREFERLIGTGLGKAGELASRGDLEAALSLYVGEFMEDVTVGEWGLEVRERLQTHYLNGLSAMADAQDAAGDPAGAAATLERLLRADGLREDACRRLMTCLNKIGLRDQALRHYQQLAARLQSQLGVLPGAEVRALADRLRTHRSR